MILALSAAAVMAIACQKYDDTALTQRVDKLETRVSSLESAMAALKTAVDSKYAVDKVEETENGYKIFFTNGKTIELLNGKNGAQGPQGDKGEDGDSFLKSVTETAEYVVIVLNDETATTFNLPKAVKIKIGGEDVVTVYQSEVLPIELPAVEGLVSVTAVVQEGSTMVLTKAGLEWNAVLADDLKSVKVKTTAKNGTKALLQLFAVKADGTTYTSSKTLVAETSVTYGDVEYKITKLADGNVWFAENLRYVPEGKTVSSTPGDGVGIWYPYAMESGVAVAKTDDATIKANGFLYDAKTFLGVESVTAENCTTFEGVQGICPEGWHIPTRMELTNLCGAATVKYGDETDNPTNTDAPFWDATLKYGTIVKANECGWNYVFCGSIANNKYNATVTKDTNTDVEEYLDKLALSVYAGSTGHATGSTPSPKVSVMQSTFTSAYKKGRLSVADSDPAKAAAVVRCVKNK